MVTCVTCSKKIERNEDYLSCRKQCNGNFHIKCLDINQDQLSSLKESGKFKTWACKQCSEVLTSNLCVDHVDPQQEFYTNVNKWMTMKIEQVMTELSDSIISPLKLEIQNLSKQNALLSQEVVSLRKILNPNLSGQVSSFSAREVAVSKHSHTPMNEPQMALQIQNRHESTNNHIFNQVKNVTQDSKMQNSTQSKSTEKFVQKNDKLEEKSNFPMIPDTNSRYADALNSKRGDIRAFKETQYNDDFITVVGRKRRQQNIATDIALKGTLEYAHLHVCGLEPNTSETDIMTYLTSKNIKNAKCSKIDSKRPEEYASFKLSVPKNIQEEAKKPELWPSGVRINRFLESIYKRKQKM